MADQKRATEKPDKSGSQRTPTPPEPRRGQPPIKKVNEPQKSTREPTGR